MVALRTAVFLLTASALLAADSSRNASPFLPPAGAAAPTQKEPSAYSFAGMTVVGGETLLSITRESDKRSTWIPLGKTVGDITAISYDAKKDEAVIRADGRELTLTIRKAVVVSAPTHRPPPYLATQPAANAPAVAPAPEPVKMPAMNQQEEKEMEARMLVSDLLEIGQQQRRAYEAAQREAAAKAAADSRTKAAK